MHVAHARSGFPRMGEALVSGDLNALNKGVWHRLHLVTGASEDSRKRVRAGTMPPAITTAHGVGVGLDPPIRVR